MQIVPNPMIHNAFKTTQSYLGSIALNVVIKYYDKRSLKHESPILSASKLTDDNIIDDCLLQDDISHIKEAASVSLMYYISDDS